MAIRSVSAKAPSQETLKLKASAKSAPRPYEPFVPGPNPRLEEFIKAHATPYDPATDKYDVPAFDRDLIVDKAAPPKAIYDMHSYWSKKHWAAIREYIRHYVPEKYYPRGTGLVLDCFSGSGMTGVAAMMEDRPCVLIDASPAAAFISHCYTHPVDPDELRAAYERTMTEPYPADLRRKLKEITGKDIANLEQELDWLYETRCDRCEGEATTEYVVYSERFQCPNCAQVVALFDCPEKQVPYPVGGRKAGRTELKKKRVCPHCLAASHGHPHREFVISTRTKKFGAVPVLVRYGCLDRCKPKSDERRHDEDRRSRKGRYFEKYDLGKIETIERAESPHWYPKGDLWKALPYRFGYKKDFRPEDARELKDLYTKRNLWALAAWLSALRRTRQPEQSVEALQLAFTGVCMGLSRMNRYVPYATFPFYLLTGTYYIPQISSIETPTRHLINKVKKIEQAEHTLLDYLNGDAVVTAESAGTAQCLQAASIDYIFTDPSYVDSVQYGELNFVWESWLGFDGSWLNDEIIVNPFRNKSVDDWESDLRAVLARCYEALKPGRWLSLCYHDTDPGTWTRVQNMLLDTGFEIHTVTVLDPRQKSLNQLFAEKVVKSDLVLNCRKARPGERGENGQGELRFVSARVREILIETLSATAGQTRDKLWDTVLKRLLTRGQMAEHRFDDILSEVAFRSESGRWFLKEEFESLSEGDIQNEERAGDALVRFARLRCAGVPATFGAEIVLKTPHLADEDTAENDIESFINDIESFIKRSLIKDAKQAAAFKLAGRLRGVEFYDCLFFYLTRWLKGRGAGATPRRNLAEFLDEYLVRFRDGEKWLYRAPDHNEAASLCAARQTGIGRRIRQFVAFIRGEGDFPPERRPDLKTLHAWMKHCAMFGLAEEGVVLFEQGGLAAQLAQLGEDDRYDAEEWYQRCRRAARRAAGQPEAEEESEEAEEASDE